jgi:hypothetical protein
MTSTNCALNWNNRGITNKAILYALTVSMFFFRYLYKSPRHIMACCDTCDRKFRTWKTQATYNDENFDVFTPSRTSKQTHDYTPIRRSGCSAHGVLSRCIVHAFSSRVQTVIGYDSTLWQSKFVNACNTNESATCKTGESFERKLFKVSSNY